MGKHGLVLAHNNTMLLHLHILKAPAPPYLILGPPGLTRASRSTLWRPPMYKHTVYLCRTTYLEVVVAKVSRRLIVIYCMVYGERQWHPWVNAADENRKCIYNHTPQGNQYAHQWSIRRCERFLYWKCKSTSGLEGKQERNGRDMICAQLIWAFLFRFSNNRTPELMECTPLC